LYNPSEWCGGVKIKGLNMTGILTKKKLSLLTDNGTRVDYNVRAITGKIGVVERLSNETPEGLVTQRIYFKFNIQKNEKLAACLNSSNVPGWKYKRPAVATIYVAECTVPYHEEMKAFADDGFSFRNAKYFEVVGVKFNGKLMFLKDSDGWQHEYNTAVRAVQAFKTLHCTDARDCIRTNG